MILQPCVSWPSRPCLWQFLDILSTRKTCEALALLVLVLESLVLAFSNMPDLMHVCDLQCTCKFAAVVSIVDIGVSTMMLA